MSSYQKVRDAFKELQPLARQLVLIDLLYDGSLDFIEVSKSYIKVLEKTREDQSRKIHRLGIRLGAAWDYIPDKKRFTKAAAAFALLQAQVFHTAPIEKEYEAYLANNAYTEDENGTPKTELKDIGRGARRNNK